MSGEIIAILAVGVALVLSTGRLRKIAIQTVRNERIGILGCLLGGCSGIFMGTAFAQEGGFYVGATAAVRLDVLYEKTVDNTDPLNISSNQGRGYQADDSDTRAVLGVGLLAGYRWFFSPIGTYLSSEINVDAPGGAVRGHLQGVGTSPGRNQLGELWPEDWSFEKGTGYGLTIRLGTSTPILRILPAPSATPSAFSTIGT